MMINKELLKEIEDYCKLNELEVSDIVNEALRGGFTVVKYGATPISAKNEKKPVEVVKTVEKVVEKIVKVSDDTKINKILEENKSLRDEIEELNYRIKDLNREISELENETDIYGE